MESVADETLQAIIDRIRDEACESSIEAVCKHLDAMARLLQRVKGNLGFPYAIADQAQIKQASDEVSELVVDLADQLPLDVPSTINDLDVNDQIGVYSDNVVDSVNASIKCALQSAAKEMIRSAAL